MASLGTACTQQWASMRVRILITGFRYAGSNYVRRQRCNLVHPAKPTIASRTRLLFYILPHVIFFPLLYSRLKNFKPSSVPIANGSLFFFIRKLYRFCNQPPPTPTSSTTTCVEILKPAFSHRIVSLAPSNRSKVLAFTVAPRSVPHLSDSSS